MGERSLKEIAMGLQKPFYGVLTGLLIGILALPGNAVSRDQHSATPQKSHSPPLAVSQASICEEVVQLKPVRPTIALSVSKGKAFCFTEIEGITSPTHIYHNWLRRDAHVVGVKLLIKPPRWSTFSSIHLRETDKGPWQVEIRDMEDTVIKTLRFSVVD